MASPDKINAAVNKYFCKIQVLTKEEEEKNKKKKTKTHQTKSQHQINSWELTFFFFWFKLWLNNLWKYNSLGVLFGFFFFLVDSILIVMHSKIFYLHLKCLSETRKFQMKSNIEWFPSIKRKIYCKMKTQKNAHLS